MNSYCYKMSQFYTCIKVTNLSPLITAQELMDLFEECGDIVSIRISRNFSGSKWAIINFGETEAVSTAELFSGTIIDGRIINVYGCFLGRNDFDSTEQFYFGRTLPLSKKEKEAIDKTSVHITSNGKTYLVHTNNTLSELVNNTFIDNGISIHSFSIELDNSDNSLHLKDIQQEEGKNEKNEKEINEREIEENEIKENIDELLQINRELESIRLDDEYLSRDSYDENFELMKQQMNILDSGYVEIPFMKR